jgi:hypothetical protein
MCGAVLAFAGMAQEPQVTPERAKAQQTSDVAQALWNKIYHQVQAGEKVYETCAKVSKKQPLPPGVNLTDLSDAMQYAINRAVELRLPLMPRCHLLSAAQDVSLADLHKAADAVTLADKQLKNVDACLAVYNKTIDEKAADITTRESELIQVCKGLDMYPPAK